MPDFSVIIPAYNEEQRLPATLASVYDYLSRSGKSFEVLVVDDGSRDRTVDVIDNFAKDHPGVRAISYQPNQGKGHALKTGVMKADGELILIDDADGSSPIEEVARLEAGIASGADIVIGSRAKPDPSRRVEALVHRKFIGNTFNLIVQSLLLPGLYDTQCGFKLFKKQPAKDIFSASEVRGYGFDVEILFIARLRGYKVEETAINWHNVTGSKVNVLVDSPKMLWDVFRIAVGSLFGRYRK
ncbi:MAG TPA: dolichyl-phosphate beta-glucosyltransferase [Candidatus Obscuribacterales bacterium]